MQNSRKALSFLTSAVLAAGAASAAFAQAPAAPAARPQVVGIVDRDKVVTSYPKAQQAVEELTKADEKLKKMIEDSNKQVDEAKSAKKPPAEIEGLTKRLQAQLEDEARRVQSRAQALEGQLENDIDSAIKAEAAARRVDVVMLKQAVLVGGTDITDGVIKRLNTVAATRAPAAK